MQKERHIACINSKNTISIEEKQWLPLVAQKSHFASIVIKHNYRPLSSCIFSSSWVIGTWTPRLPLTLYILERIIKNSFLIVLVSLSLFLSKTWTRKLSLTFSLSGKRWALLSNLVVRKNDKSLLKNNFYFFIYINL